MAYCTQADLERRVGGAAKLVQLADHDGNGAIDAGLVDAAIAEADGEVNRFMNKRFAVPLNPVPPEVVALSAKIAARVLRRWRGMLTADDASDEKNDLAALASIAKGETILSILPAAKSPIAIDQAGERDSTKNVSREKLKGFW